MGEKEPHRSKLSKLLSSLRGYSANITLRLSSGYLSLKRMIEISGADEIYRRYFVMNMFDGALAALGVIMGMWVSGIKDSRAIIRTVLAAGFAMFLSGFLGAYLTEKAERERKIREIEEAMFMRMSGSLIEKSSKLAIILVSVVDGISPLIACVILVLPFIVVPSYESNFEIIASASLSIGMITLSALGLLLSRVARERSVKYPLYMILAGLVSAMIIILLGGYV